MNQQITLKRYGEWLDSLALALTGYIINEYGQIMESEGLTTIIRPVDFDNLATAEYCYQDVGGSYPIKIELSGEKYFMDYSLANMTFDVAEKCLYEARDILMDEIDTP